MPDKPTYEINETAAGWEVTRTDDRPLRDKESQTYIVTYDYVEGWTCECADHHFRRKVCKHIKMVQEKSDWNPAEDYT